MSWTVDSSGIRVDSSLYTADGSGPNPPSPQFPNVPALPGVPNLARLVPAAVVAAQATDQGETMALAAQLGLPTITIGPNAFYGGLGLSPLGGQYGGATPPDNPNPFIPGAMPLYGITSADTTPILIPDSAIEFDINADSNINSHPIEQGGFSAYNRVQEPISIRLLLACQGKRMSRKIFLSTLESLRQGTQIVTVSTPDTTYPNMTLKGYGYKKTAERGAVTIWADTQWVEQQSTNVTVSVPPTSQPQGAAVTNLGTLSALTPTPQQQAAISNPPIPPSPLPPSYTGTQPPSGNAM